MTTDGVRDDLVRIADWSIGTDCPLKFGAPYAVYECDRWVREFPDRGFVDFFKMLAGDDRAECIDWGKGLKDVGAKGCAKLFSSAKREIRKQRGGWLPAKPLGSISPALEEKLSRLSQEFDKNEIHSQVEEFITDFVAKNVKHHHMRIHHARLGAAELIAAVLDGGVDLAEENRFGETLMTAALSGYATPVLKLLAKRGAKPDLEALERAIRHLEKRNPFLWPDQIWPEHGKCIDFLRELQTGSGS